MRPADIDGAAGSVQELDRIVSQIREAWPEVPIIVRGDSSFCREEIRSWCERHQVDYVLGLAKNARLIREMEPELAQARPRANATGQGARGYKEFSYQTLDSWSCSRRVVGKAEVLPQGDNPRFVVTSLSSEQRQAQPL